MTEITTQALDTAIAQLRSYDPGEYENVKESEDIIDRYEDRLGTYLIQISRRELKSRDSHTLSVLLHSIGDLERISDHAVNIVNAAREIHEKKLAFSEAAKAELQVMSEAVKEIVGLAMEAVKTENLRKAEQVQPLEEVIDNVGAEVKKRHIERLRKGICTIELGFILSDLLTSYKRIADHCSNISVCLIQADNDEFGRHAYLDSLKAKDNREFQDAFRRFSEKFSL
jgi:phosphate:Na+ symporter